MKKIVFVVLLLSIHVSLGAQEITGFWGLKFGMTREKAIPIILSKAEVDEDELYEESIYISSASFGGVEFNRILITFLDDNVKSGLFSFVTKNQTKAVEVFLDLKTSLTNKYGEGREGSTELKYFWGILKRNNASLSIDVNAKGEHVVSLFYLGRVNNPQDDF